MTANFTLMSPVCPHLLSTLGALLSQARIRDQLFAEAAARELAQREALATLSASLRVVVGELSTSAAVLTQRDDVSAAELARAEELHAKTNRAVIAAMVSRSSIPRTPLHSKESPPSPPHPRLSSTSRSCRRLQRQSASLNHRVRRTYSTSQISSALRNSEAAMRREYAGTQLPSSFGTFLRRKPLLAC